VSTAKILGYFKELKRFKYQRFVENGVIKEVVSLLGDKCTERQSGESPFAFNKALGSFGIPDVSQRSISGLRIRSNNTGWMSAGARQKKKGPKALCFKVVRSRGLEPPCPCEH